MPIQPTLPAKFDDELEYINRLCAATKMHMVGTFELTESLLQEWQTIRESLQTNADRRLFELVPEYFWRHETVVAIDDLVDAARKLLLENKPINELTWQRARRAHINLSYIKEDPRKY